jgi:hypothetical protein
MPLSTSNVIRSDAYYEHHLPGPNGWEFKIRGFPGWQLVQHLPFVEDGYTLYGITVFCAGWGGMSGMGVHFRSNKSFRLKSRWVGDQFGSPIHFFLAPTERIISVWIRRHLGMCFPGPFLMVSSKIAIGHSRPCLFIFLLD